MVGGVNGLTKPAHPPRRPEVKNETGARGRGWVQRMVRPFVAVCGSTPWLTRRIGLGMSDLALQQRSKHDLEMARHQSRTAASNLRQALSSAKWGALYFEEAGWSLAIGLLRGCVRRLRVVGQKLGFAYLCDVKRPNDPSSATRPARRHDCNSSAMAGFAAAHG